MANETFYIDKTIQSQYSASPHIEALVNAFWDCLNPEADIELIYNNMVNLDTAVDFGLDVWGRIVAVGREYVAVAEDYPYFGFSEEGVINDRAYPFDNAPFYTQVTGKVKLSDDAYRTYIFIKAMINIGDSTLSSLNRMIATMFPDADIKILHVDTMKLRVLIMSEFSEADKGALLNLQWLPTGVGLEIYHIITPTFGFDGSGLMPFDQGTFGYEDPIVIEAD